MNSAETLKASEGRISQTRRLRRILRRIAAVVAGLAVNVVFGVGTDGVLHATGIYPPFGQPMSDGLFLLATAYRILFGIAGCYLAARLAADHPMGHALSLGVIGLVISIAGAVATWNKGPEFGPHWYPVAIIAVTPPSAWLGGKLRLMQLSRRTKAY